MRNSKILVCSNSQFSLTAGLLNANGLVILPKQWYGNGSKLNDIIKPINEACDFQLLTYGKKNGIVKYVKDQNFNPRVSR